MSVFMASEDVTYLIQRSRIDFVKTGECGFDGSSLGLQQLDNESDSMAYLCNSNANLALSPLQCARSLKFGLAHRLLRFFRLHQPRRTFKHFDYNLARIVHLLYGRGLDKHAKQCSVGVRQEHGLNPCVCWKALKERVWREERHEHRELL